jgi:hypothetical protein
MTMTTGTSPDRGTAARRWAAELLGVQENTPPVEARRAYFRKLRENDFLPERSLHHAALILEGKPVPAEVEDELLLEEESRLHADVESFAEELFKLPPSQRRERWHRLFSRCRSALPLMTRLQALKAGLDVDTAQMPLDQSARDWLVAHLLESFPLRPQAQAAARQAFLREIEGRSDHKAFENAARYLLAEWPTLAALDKQLLQYIAKLRSHLKRRWKNRVRNRGYRETVTPAGTKGKDELRKLIVWAVLLAVALWFKLSILPSLKPSDGSSSSRPPAPGYSAPNDSMRFIPPIEDLLDPSKFDVEIVGSHRLRILRFTPRPSSTVTGSSGPQANDMGPVLIGEAALRLRGVSKEQVDLLFSRAAKKKPLDRTPKADPARP